METIAHPEMMVHMRYRRQVLLDGGSIPIRIARLTYKPLRKPGESADGDEEVQVHDHDFMEIVLVLGGRCTHKTVDGEQTIHTGDVFILRPGAWHGYYNCRNLTIANCCFGPELLHRELGWMVTDPFVCNILWRGPLADDRKGVLHLSLDKPALQASWNAMDKLRQSLARLTGLNRAEAIGYLVILISTLAASYTGEDPDRVAPQPWSPVAMSAIRLIEDQIAAPWSLAVLADRLQMDESYISRLVKQATGVPPMAYLARRRAEHAARLLLRTSMSISNIAVAVGWHDPILFARRFKAHFGVTASQYRLQFQKLTFPPKSGRA